MEQKRFPIKWGKGMMIAFILADVIFLFALAYNLYDLFAHVLPAGASVLLPLLFIFLYVILCVILLGITLASGYVLTEKGLSVRLGLIQMTVPYASMNAVLSYPNDEYFILYTKKGANRTQQLLTPAENCTRIIREILHRNPSVHYEVYLDDHENHE